MDTKLLRKLLTVNRIEEIRVRKSRKVQDLQANLDTILLLATDLPNTTIVLVDAGANEILRCVNGAVLYLPAEESE